MPDERSSISYAMVVHVSMINHGYNRTQDSYQQHRPHYISRYRRNHNLSQRRDYAHNGTSMGSEYRPDLRGDIEKTRADLLGNIYNSSNDERFGKGQNSNTEIIIQDGGFSVEG